MAHLVQLNDTTKGRQKSSIKKLMALFTWLLSLSFAPSFSQNLDETYQFGLEQYALANYETASLAFERVLYFGDGKYAVNTLDHLARIRMSKGDIEGALKFYHRASVTSNDFAEKSYYTLRKCSGLLALQQTKLAMIDLFDISDELPDSTVLYKYFLLGVAHYSELDFNESRIAFKNAIPETDVIKRNQVDSLFNIVQSIKHPKPKTAKILSIFFPGAGQFYAGDVKNGINSLLLTGGFLFLGINTVINYGLFNSFVSVFPWFQRYYMGGYHRAERIAENRLREKQDAVFQSILNVY
jgi:tetratricopeptide (TPR) repeat protein